MVLTGDRVIQWFNPRAGRMLGLRRKVDFGHRIDNLVRNPDFQNYLDKGDYSYPVVIRKLTSTDVHLSLQMVDYGKGQKLLAVRDVSREILVEAMRKDFVANASHELRSPLTVIVGYVDTLADDPLLDSDVRLALQEMRRQSARMQAVVDDLIELSRLEIARGRSSKRRRTLTCTRTTMFCQLARTGSNAASKRCCPIPNTQCAPRSR